MAPITDGLNVIAKVHLEAGAKEPPQGVKLVPTAVKSALAVRAEMFTAVGPLLVKVTVFAAAVVPINSFEKTVLVGLKVREAADPPVPRVARRNRHAAGAECASGRCAENRHIGRRRGLAGAVHGLPPGEIRRCRPGTL